MYKLIGVIFFLFYFVSVQASERQYKLLTASTTTIIQQINSDQEISSQEFSSLDQGSAWLTTMSGRLKRFVPEQKAREDFLSTVYYEATRAGLDPQLVLSIIQVESSFKKYAISSAGARGYMQIMPFWIETIGTEDHNLFHLRVNLRYGCTILRHYLDIEKGNYFRALGRYNGSLGQATYPQLVFNTWRESWAYPS